MKLFHIFLTMTIATSLTTTNAGPFFSKYNEPVDERANNQALTSNRYVTESMSNNAKLFALYVEKHFDKDAIDPISNIICNSINKKSSIADQNLKKRLSILREDIMNAPTDRSKINLIKFYADQFSRIEYRAFQEIIDAQCFIHENDNEE